MIQASSHPSSSALATVEPRSNYFASQTHYESLARRIAAALSRGGRFVLVTGDPPPNPQCLRQALGNVEGVGYAVIDIHCGPALRGKDLALAVPMRIGPSRSEGAVVPLESSGTASPLFLFIDFDQLSDRQIEEVCEGTLGDQRWTSGVLLAPLDFADRLERPDLHFLKERLAAHVCIQEVGDDEVIPFLHNQLLAQRDRRSEARGFRRGILIGLAGCGVVLAASTSAFLILHPTGEQVSPAPTSAGESSSPSDKVSMLGPTEQAATVAVPAQPAPKIETTAALSTASPPPPAPSLPLAAVESPGRVATPDPPTAPRLSASDIAGLLVRGDAFLSANDITSARLYYERAAEVGDGQAALRLGASFDPVVLGLAGVRGVIGDPSQAMSWYQRARELGADEAEQRIKALQSRAFGEAR